jgi:hypothetical protein
MNPLHSLAIAVAIAAVAISVGLYRLSGSHAARDALSLWTARDWRAMAALVASIAGAAMLTWFAWWLTDMLSDFATRLISELVRDREARPEVGGVLVTIINALAWCLKLLMGGIIAVLLAMGLAINPRRLRFGKDGLDMSGGDEPSPATIAGASAGAAAGAIAGNEAGKDAER